MWPLPPPSPSLLYVFGLILCLIFYISILTLQEFWIGPIHDTRGRPDLKDNSLRPCLFVLREDKTLSRYDLDSGKLLQSVFLSSHRKYVEIRLNSSRSQPNVCVKSTKQSGFCNNPMCRYELYVQIFF